MTKKEKPFNNPFASLSLKKEKPAPAPVTAPGKAAPAGPKLGKTPRAGAASTPVVGAPPVSSEETRLFLESVGEVAPVRRVLSRPRHTPPALPAPKAPTDDDDVMAELSELVAGDAPFELSSSEETITGHLAHLDPRMLKRLKRGEFAYEARLDLHGFTREEGRTELERFLVSSRHAGHRCVLVVHGRGLHSRDQVGVLKESVSQWLSQGRLGRQVLAFTSAQPQHGGAGAVYVLLRR